MVGWRALIQVDVDECWKKIAVKIEEDVLHKHKVEDSTREACRSRGMPLEWRRVRRTKKYRIRKLCEDRWTRIFSRFREYQLQRIHSMKEGWTEEEEIQ